MHRRVTAATAQEPPQTSPRKRLGAIAAAVLALIALVVTVNLWYMNYVPANLDTTTAKLSERGIYHVSYSSADRAVPINELHSWTVRVTAPDGTPIDDALISVDGDMPQHGHGLPTQPQVTEYLGDGHYLVEGVKFQMTGWWYLEFQIASASLGEDLVRFDFVLP